MTAYYINIAALVVLGILGAASVIIKKNPDAKEMIEKLSKVSGWLGLVAALWGIWIIINSVLNLGMLAGGLTPLLLWVTGLATGAVMAFLGFIFGYGMVTVYMADDAKAKGEAMRQKLAGFQVLLGFVSLGCAAWWLILLLLF